MVGMHKLGDLSSILQAGDSWDLRSEDLTFCLLWAGSSVGKFIACPSEKSQGAVFSDPLLSTANLTPV